MGLSNSFSLTNSLGNSLLESRDDEGLSREAAKLSNGGERFKWVEGDSSVNSRTCPRVEVAKSDVDTVEEFGKFNFQVSRKG